MAKSPKMTVILSLDMDKFNKGISTAQIKMESFGKSAVSTGKSLSMGVTVPILGLGAAMIKLSSDAAETNNKFNEIFGKEAKQTGHDLEKLANIVGRDSIKMKEFAGDIGGVATSIGFTNREAGKLSKKMIKLGIDVGSFRNKSDDQVIKAFTSALVGEREALKSLGVSMSEADVQAEAFRMTGKRNAKDLTKQEKALATVSLLYRLFNKDVGDAERTQKEFANQLKTFGANISEVARKFGDELKPIANQFLLIINPMIKNFANLNSETKRNILIVGALVGAIGPLLIGLGLMSQALALGLGGYVSLYKGVTKTISVLNSFMFVSKTVTSTLGAQTLAQNVLGGSAAATTTTVVKQSRAMVLFGSVANTLKVSIIAVAAALSGLTFAGVIAGIKAMSAAALVLIQRFAMMLIPIGAVVTALALVVNAGLTVYRHWDELKEATVQTWNEITSAIGESVKEIKRWIVDKTKPIVDWLIDAWDLLSFTVNAAWTAIASSIGGVVKKIVGWIKDKILVAINLMIKGYNKVAEVVGGTPIEPFGSFDEIVDTAVEAYDIVKTRTKEFASDVVDGVKEIGRSIVEAKPFQTFINETKENMALAKRLFDSTLEKMKGFSFGGGGEEKQEAPKGGGGDQNQITFFDMLKEAGLSAYEALIAKMAAMKAAQDALILKNQETITKFTEGWFGFSANFKGIVADMQLVTSTMFQQFTEGVGTAFANAAFEGANLVDQLKDLAINMGKAIIQMLIKIGIERATQAVVGAALSKATGVAEVQSSVGRAFAGGIASMSAAPWPLNLTAPAFGAAMAASAAGGFAMLAKGGVTTGPTLAMIGEGSENEAVLPLSKLDAMVNGGRNGQQTIILELDGRKMMEALIPHQPSVVRYTVGVNY